MMRWESPPIPDLPDRLELRCPSSWAEYFDLRAFTNTAIRLGDWPEDTYAGRLSAFTDDLIPWRSELERKIKIVR